MVCWYLAKSVHRRRTDCSDLCEGQSPALTFLPILQSTSPSIYSPYDAKYTANPIVSFDVELWILERMVPAEFARDNFWKRAKMAVLCERQFIAGPVCVNGRSGEK
ncbi:1820_t:CDS:2, partial [Acaulospora colombiana]